MSDSTIEEFNRIRTVAEELVASEYARDAMFDAVQRIFDMDWDRAPTDAQIRPMVSPGGHNVIRGMVNIMTGVEPSFNVPCAEGNVEDEERRDMLEKTLRAMFRAADYAHGHSLVADMALSGALFDLIALKLVRTKDHAAMLREKADRKATPQERKRLERQIAFYEDMAKSYPFLVDSLTPNTIYYKRGPGGLLYLVEARRRTVHSLREEFGETACPKHRLTDTVLYYEYWDRYQCCKWSEDSTEPFLLTDYDIPSFIPYIVTEVSGTDLFGEQRLYPILYPLWKGDIWQAQNLAMTMWRSNLYAMGNPTLVCTGPSAHEADIPLHLAGGRVNLNAGDSISQLSVSLAPPELLSFHSMARTLEEESTVNKMVFGRAPDTLLAYSTVNLLVQGARHSLVSLQFAMSRATTELARKMLRWVKESGESVDLYGQNFHYTLRPDDIEQQAMMLVEAKLRPDIPSDRLQMANMAKMLVDSGIMSRYTARGLAGYDQPEEEEERILRERIRQIVTQSKLQGLEQTLQVSQQMAKQEEEASQQAAPQPAPQEFIPPAESLGGEMMEMGEERPGGRPGFIGQEANIPIVQALGQPPEKFQQAAQMNMGSLEELEQ